MFKFIQLTLAAERTRNQESSTDVFRDTDDVGEPQESRPATSGGEAPAEDRSITVNVHSIRSMKARHGGAPGTFIKFNDGAGLSFEETRETIMQMANPN